MTWTSPQVCVWSVRGLFALFVAFLRPVLRKWSTVSRDLASNVSFLADATYKGLLPQRDLLHCIRPGYSILKARMIWNRCPSWPQRKGPMVARACYIFLGNPKEGRNTGQFPGPLAPPTSKAPVATSAAPGWWARSPGTASPGEARNDPN